MSQFESFSEDFRRSMERMAEDLAPLPNEDPNAKVLSLVQEYVSKVVPTWLSGLSKEETGKVMCLFEELNRMSPEDILKAMSSPFDLPIKMAADSEEPEVVEPEVETSEVVQ